MPCSVSSFVISCSCRNKKYVPIRTNPIAIKNIQMTLFRYPNATAQMLSKRWTISTAPLGRPLSKTIAKARYNDWFESDLISFTTVGPGPRRRTFFVSSGIGDAGALPAAAVFSVKSPCDSCQTRTLTIVGREPLIRLAARVRASESREPMSLMCWARSRA